MSVAKGWNHEMGFIKNVQLLPSDDCSFCVKSNPNCFDMFINSDLKQQIMLKVNKRMPSCQLTKVIPHRSRRDVANSSIFAGNIFMCLVRARIV